MPTPLASRLTWQLPQLENAPAGSAVDAWFIGMCSVSLCWLKLTMVVDAHDGTSASTWMSLVGFGDRPRGDAGEVAGNAHIVRAAVAAREVEARQAAARGEGQEECQRSLRAAAVHAMAGSARQVPPRKVRPGRMLWVHIGDDETARSSSHLLMSLGDRRRPRVHGSWATGVEPLAGTCTTVPRLRDRRRRPRNLVGLRSGRVRTAHDRLSPNCATRGRAGRRVAGRAVGTGIEKSTRPCLPSFHFSRSSRSRSRAS